jgi:hypothetical protein
VSRSLRFLMGVAIVSILVPAMAMVIPHGNNERTSPATAQAMASIERDPTLTQQPSVDSHSSLQAPSTAETTPPSVETSPSGNDHSDHTAHHDDEAKAESEESSTTLGARLPETTTSSSPRPKNDGVITGTACPCTIAGKAELKGEIRLEGDLIVDGGTLVARPGVDLDGNGFQIMFMNGGKADFQGSRVFTWSDRGTKQNLQRDINFRNLRRIMWMANGGASILKYFTVSDSGTSAVGDYPLHWHLNGNSTRGTIVEGVVVINGKNHAYVPHGSHGITFRDVIAKNTTGDAFWWDPPGSNGSCKKGVGCDPIDNSNDILYDHALVDGVIGVRGVAGFVLGAGDNPVVRNSAAININSTNPSKRFCTGFKWPEFTNGSSRGVNTVWTFQNNFSYSPSGCDGINVWQNDKALHVIDGFSGSGIDHGAYGNRYVYRNFDVTDVLIHAAGWRMESGHAGDVVTARHRSDVLPTVQFDNVTVDSFTINNASNDGNVPGHYVLNGSGLTCDDIIYREVVPGTTVILDGEECQ